MKSLALALASKVKSLALALASRPQVLENWPVLGSRTARFFGMLKFCGALEKFFGKRFLVFLLSQFDKLFENLIYTRIYSYVQKYNLLREKQFSFRQNHSTIHAISHMYDSLLKNVDQEKYSCCIFWICQKLSTLKVLELCCKS